MVYGICKRNRKIVWYVRGKGQVDFVQSEEEIKRKINEDCLTHDGCIINDFKSVSNFTGCGYNSKEYGISKWRFNADSELDESKEYEIVKCYGNKTEIIKDMTVYSKPNAESTKSTMKAQKVSFKKLLIHNEKQNNNKDVMCGYIYVEAEDGGTGWMIFKDNIEDNILQKKNKQAFNGNTGIYCYSINGEISSKYIKEYSDIE